LWSGRRCDLPDITLIFGTDRGRFYDLKKRAVDNLNCGGPLIKTIMTRCIHCTRCVRFLNEISGIYNLGVLGRGLNMEIGTYIKNVTFLSELSGNIIDLCPVGALTSMPYAFTARAWELEKFNTIDVMDALGSAIRVDIVNNKIVRILPRLDEAVNEEWITNKARFIYDSISIQRLVFPKLKYNLKFFVISWNLAFDLIIFYLNQNYFKQLESYCGNFIDLETAYALKCFFNGIGCSNIFFVYDLNYNIDFKFMYLLNITLEALENINLIFLIGCNLRLEAPLILTRIRKSFLNYENDFKIFSLGLAINNFNFYVKNIGNSVKAFKLFLEGKLEHINTLFLNNINWIFINFKINKNPIFFIGTSVLIRYDSLFLIKSILYIFSFFSFLNNFFENLNFISTNLGLLSGHEFNLFKNKLNSNLKNKFLYLINADIKDYDLDYFIIYQGYFINSSFIYFKANLLLPALVYLEKNSTYINLEGRYRLSNKTVFPSSFVYADFDIIQCINLLKNKIISKNFSIIEKFFDIILFFNKLIHYDCLFFSSINYFLNNLRLFFWYENWSKKIIFLQFITFFFNKYKLINSVLSQIINNYYQTDIFCRNSKIMSLCSSKMIIKNFIYINKCR
jgi:NADH-quinone oxidoreductase subunit G